MTKTKIYPNRVLEDELRKRGIHVMLFWEIPGPKNTAIAWISCYIVRSMIVHVITYKPNGWDVMTPVPALMIDATVQEVLERSRAFSSATDSKK